MKARVIVGFALGPIGAAALSLISLPILAWLFEPSMIGQLSMLQVAIRFCTLLCCLGLDQAYVREYHGSTDRSKLLFNATVPGLMVFGVGCVVVASSPHALSRLLYGESAVSFTVITLLCLLMAYLVRFLSLILRMQDRGFAFSMSQLLAKLLLLVIALAYALVSTHRDFMMLLLAQAAAWAACLLIFAWNTRGDWLPALRSHFDRAEFGKLLTFGWPLVFGGVASWALAAMDRIFLRSMASYGELAIYSVAASVASGVTILGGIFNIVWAPMVYKWHAEKADPAMIDGVAETMLLAVCVVVCLAGGGAPVLRAMLPPSYIEVPALLPLCVAAPLLYTLSEVTGIGIEIQRKTMLSMLASIAAVLVNVALCFALVPKLGAVGAATATACAFWVFFAVRTIASVRAWVNKFSIRQHLAAASVVGVPLLVHAIPQHWLWVINVLWWVCVVILVTWNRQRLLLLVTRVMHARDSQETS